MSLYHNSVMSQVYILVCANLCCFETSGSNKLCVKKYTFGIKFRYFMLLCYNLQNAPEF